MRTRRLMKRSQPFLLMAPAFTAVGILSLFPVLHLIQFSVRRLRIGDDWTQAPVVGWQNFAETMTNPTFWLAVNKSVKFTGIALGTELLAGLAIALLLHQRIAGRSVLTACLIVPMVLMPSLVGMTWRLYFHWDGLMNYLIELITGNRINWNSIEHALSAVMIVDIWQWTPFFTLVFLAGLQSLPSEPFDAARVDGASPWQAFKYITLPLISPLILVASILRLMDLMRLFDVLFAMFGGGPGNATETLPVHIFLRTMVRQDLGRGSAASLVLIVITVMLSLLLVYLLQRRDRGVDA